MLRRGQRIIITKSSAINNVHPKVGDVGYLSSAFIYPAHKLILVEIMFYQYKEDVRKGKNRLERKKFIIDLGIPKAIKYKLSKTGVEKNFFINTSEHCVPLFITNMNMSVINNKRTRIFSHINNPTYKLWHRNTNSHHKIKIPIGQLALFNTVFNKKHSLTDCSTNEFKAWFRCMRVLIHSLLVLPPDVKNDMKFISKEANRIYSRADNNGRRLDTFMFFSKNDHLDLKSDPNSPLSSYDKRFIIEHIQYFNSLMATLLNRIDKNIVSKIGPKRNKDILQRQWQHVGLDSLREIDKWNAIRVLFLRSLLTNESTPLKFKLLNDILPNRLNNDYNIKEIDEIKLLGRSNSAALNRFYKGGYIN